MSIQLPLFGFVDEREKQPKKKSLIVPVCGGSCTACQKDALTRGGLCSVCRRKKIQELRDKNPEWSRKDNPAHYHLY